MKIDSKLLFAFVFLLILPVFASAADVNVAGVVELVEQHQNRAPDVDHELGLVTELEKLAGADNWLPNFWASYFLTQVVMSHSGGEKGSNRFLIWSDSLTIAYNKPDR